MSRAYGVSALVFVVIATGVAYMNILLAARSQIRNVVVCSLLATGLAACGSDGSGSSTASATAPNSSVSPNVGFVDRTGTGSTDTSGSTSPIVIPPTVSNPPPATTPPATSSGTVTLDWTPPIENSDGSVLTNLAGYTVHYGTSPGNLDKTVKVTNPGLTAYAMTNLGSGTWYFAVTAYSSTGTESSLSGVVSKTI
jgi:hypothetical protein